MKNCFLLLLSIFSLDIQAQVNTDSLWSVWQNENANDTARLESLNKYIWSTSLFENPEKAFDLAQEHFEFAVDKSLEKYQGQALSTQGVSFAIRGDYEKALSYYKKSLIHFENQGYKKGIASICNNIGAINHNKGDLDAAIENYTKSMKMMQELGNIKALSKAQSNIGNVYSDKGDLTSALEYYEKSYANAKKNSDKNGMIHALNNIAILYDNIHEYEKAIEYFKQCYDLIDEHTENRLILEAGTLNNLGSTYSNLGNDQLALKYYAQSLELKKQLDNPYDIALTMSNIASIYLVFDSLEIAEEYLNESLKLFGESEDFIAMIGTMNLLADLHFRRENYRKAIAMAEKNLSEAKKSGNLGAIKSATRILYKSHKAIGNTERALDMLELYQKTEDSLLSVENQKEIIGHSFRYEYEKKVAADSLKALEEKIKTDARIAMQKTQLEKERIQRFSLYGGIFVVLVFGLIMYRRFQESQKQKRIIESQKDQVEKQRSLLSDRNKKITDSIVYAKRIQSAILPPDRILEEYLGDAFVLYLPKDVVAGDFYWVKKVKNKIFFAVADCTGHGVPGAMVSVICNSALNRAVGEYGLSDVGQILDKTREIVIEEFEKADEEVKDGMDIALCSLHENILEYAGAHNPLWLMQNGEMRVIRADKQPIGMYIRHEKFRTHRIELNKGDSLYVFTDGFADQFGGPNGKKFKAKALRDSILAIHNKSMKEQKTELEKIFKDWKGNEEQLDDVCILGMRF